MDARNDPSPAAVDRSDGSARGLRSIVGAVRRGFVGANRDSRHPSRDSSPPARGVAGAREDASAADDTPGPDLMARLPIQRHTSTLEAIGLWFALAVALTTASALSRTSIFALLALDAEEWSDLGGIWRYTMGGMLPVVVVLALVPRWLPRRRLWRWPLLVLTAVLGAGLGWLVQDRLRLLCCGAPIPREEVAMHLHTLLVPALMVAVLGEYRRAQLHAAAALHAATLGRLRLQAELAAGRLQMLQAQIEPHFLFNSLANVRRLLRVDGPAGRAMLADLLRYLESALPRLRDDAPTLGREVEITRAFLGVHQVRMSGRLEVEFDIPDAAAQQVVPPMMLLTLVENALKHGIHPLPEGGRIHVAASGAEGRLRLSVADTGRGLVFGQGSGTGLANVRARLKSMYGADAALSLQLNAPRGVVATIELPWR